MASGGSRIVQAASKLETPFPAFGLESVMRELRDLSMVLYGNFNFKTIPEYLKSTSFN